MDREEKFEEFKRKMNSVKFLVNSKISSTFANE